jgi:hypothetical protein
LLGKKGELETALAIVANLLARRPIPKHESAASFLIIHLLK